MTTKDTMLLFGNLWKEKYKVAYPWKWGKDSRLLKSCTAYFDGVYGDLSPEKFTEAVMAYLNDRDPILVKIQHPVGSFCQMPTRWMKGEKEEKPKVEPPLEVIPTRPSVEEFRQRWLAYCTPDPVKALAGFKMTSGVLKGISPECHKIAEETLKDLLGLERYEYQLTLPDTLIMD